VKAQLRHLCLQALDDGDRGVLVEVVHDQYLERSRTGSLDDPAQRRHHVFAFVVDGNHDAESW
jgi:hypothetical protein